MAGAVQHATRPFAVRTGVDASFQGARTGEVKDDVSVIARPAQQRSTVTAITGGAEAWECPPPSGLRLATSIASYPQPVDRGPWTSARTSPPGPSRTLSRPPAHHISPRSQPPPRQLPCAHQEQHVKTCPAQPAPPPSQQRHPGASGPSGRRARSETPSIRAASDNTWGWVGVSASGAPESPGETPRVIVHGGRSRGTGGLSTARTPPTAGPSHVRRGCPTAVPRRPVPAGRGGLCPTGPVVQSRDCTRCSGAS